LHVNFKPDDGLVLGQNFRTQRGSRTHDYYDSSSG
jgi:hypothetical protein